LLWKTNTPRRKIEKLLNSPEKREKMGEASRVRALKLSWQNVAKEYYALYENI